MMYCLIFVCSCVCVCVCVPACVVHMHIHHEEFICLGFEFQRTDLRCCVEEVSFLCQVPSLLLQMKQQAFLTSRLILFSQQKRSKPRLNQLYVCLAFKPWVLHRPLLGIAFKPHYILSRFVYCTNTHKRGLSLTRKRYSNYKLPY